MTGRPAKSNMRVKVTCKEGGVVERVLTGTIVARSDDFDHVMHSRFTWRPEPSLQYPSYALSVLGVLNGFFGIYLDTHD